MRDTPICSSLNSQILQVADFDNQVCLSGKMLLIFDIKRTD